MTTPDFHFQNHFNVVRLTPLTPTARDWLEAHIECEDWQVLGLGVVIEPRYANAMLEGLVADGFTVA